MQILHGVATHSHDHHYTWSVEATWGRGHWQGVQGISPPVMLPGTMYSPGGQGEPCNAAGWTDGPQGSPAIVGAPASVAPGAGTPATTGGAPPGAPATTGCW